MTHLDSAEAAPPAVDAPREARPLYDWKTTAALVAAMALVVAGLVISLFNEGAYRHRKAQYLQASAEVLAKTVSPALLFNDAPAAQEYVDALRANSDIDLATVTDASGALVARYARGDFERGPKPAAAPGNAGLTVTAPVRHEGQVIGEVSVEITPEPLVALLSRHAGTALLAAMAALVLTVFGLSQRWLARAHRDTAARAAALAEANARLEEQVTRRQEVEEALRQSQKMEAIGQLTGGIAHDFNNLLQAVHGNLEMIRRRPDDPARVKRWADNGYAAAERGARLTAQLLAFSRDQKLQLRSLRIGEIAPRLKELLTTTLGPSIAVSFDLADGGAPVLADATQLELAVLNLAINARDAMPDGGTLTIASAVEIVSDDPELETGAYVALSVADNGAGMPADVRARAFDPFFTTKGVGKGTGLGLAQVYGIAKQAGGVARIASTPGGGTTITLLLPLTDRDEVAALAPARGAHKVREGATILVVDDDDGVRAFIRDALETLGYKVREAADGVTALDALNIGAVDLLLLDFAMPGMNGAQVARAALARRPDLSVLFASGYAETAALQEAAGTSVAVIRKPFDIDELGEAVFTALAG
jgi:signal transduction histidine kinase/CheY-like chemotaxis protein